MLRPQPSVILLLVFVLGVNNACFLRPKSSTQEKTSSETLVKTNLPPPVGFVNDFAGVFEPEAKARLESLLERLRQDGNIEFAVVTVETTNGHPIFDYSLVLANEWKVGPKDSRAGLLFMLAVKDRKWWIQVTKALEGDLPDSLCKQLGDQSVDLYKQGRYGEGVEKLVRLIVARLEQTRSFHLPRT